MKALVQVSFVLGLTAALSGCVLVPQPHAFVNSTNAVARIGVEEYHARAEGLDLVLEVHPKFGPLLYGMESFEAGGDVYFYLVCDTVFSVPTISQRHTHYFPRTTVTNGMYQFRFDLRPYQLGTNWTSHLYWLVDDFGYPIFNSGYWSANKRDPVGRLPIIVTE